MFATVIEFYDDFGSKMMVEGYAEAQNMYSHVQIYDSKKFF